MPQRTDDIPPDWDISPGDVGLAPDDLGAKLYATFFIPPAGTSLGAHKEQDQDAGGQSIQEEIAIQTKMAVDLVDKPHILSTMPPGCDIHRLQTRVSELRVALEAAILRASNMEVKHAEMVEAHAKQALVLKAKEADSNYLATTMDWMVKKYQYQLPDADLQKHQKFQHLVRDLLDANSKLSYNHLLMHNEKSDALAQLASQKAAVGNECERCSAETGQLRVTYNAKTREVENLMKAMDDASRKIEELESLLKNEQRTFQQEASKAHCQASKLQNRIEHLEAVNKQLASSIKSKETEMEKWIGKVERLQSELDEAELERDVQESRLAGWENTSEAQVHRKYQNDLDALRKAANERESTMEQSLSKAEDALKVCQEECDRKNSELEEEINRLKKTCQGLEGIINANMELEEKQDETDVDYHEILCDDDSQSRHVSQTPKSRVRNNCTQTKGGLVPSFHVKVLAKQLNQTLHVNKELLGKAQRSHRQIQHMKSEKNKLEKEASQMKVCLQRWTGVAKSKADELQKLEIVVDRLQEDNLRIQSHVQKNFGQDQEAVYHLKNQVLGRDREIEKLAAKNAELLLDLETESVANLLCDMERKKLETEVTEVAEHRAALEKQYEEKLKREVAEVEQRFQQRKRKSCYLDGVAQTELRTENTDVGIQCSSFEPLLTDAWVQSDHLNFTDVVACQTDGFEEPGMIHSIKSSMDVVIEDNLTGCVAETANRNRLCASLHGEVADGKSGCSTADQRGFVSPQKGPRVSIEERGNMVTRGLEENACMQDHRGSASCLQHYNGRLQESMQLRGSHESLMKPHCNGYDTPPPTWGSEQVAWDRYANGTDCSSILGSATPGCRSSWHSQPGSCRLVDGSAIGARESLPDHNHDYCRRNSLDMGSEARESFSHTGPGNTNMVNRWHSSSMENQPNDLCCQHSDSSRLSINASTTQQSLPHGDIEQVKKTTSWRSHSPELSDCAYSARCSHNSDYHQRRSHPRPFENPIFQLRRSQENREGHHFVETSMKSKQDGQTIREECSNGNLSHGDDLAEYSDCSSVLHCNDYHETVLRGLRWSERLSENNTASCDRYGDSCLRNSGSFASTPTNQSILSTPKAETGAISPTLPAPERDDPYGLHNIRSAFMKAQITNPRKSISASLKRSFANCRPVHTLPPLEPVPEAQLQNTSNHEIRKDKYSDPIGHQEWSTHDNQYLRENTACMEKFSPLSSAFHDDIHEMIHVAEQQREKSEQQERYFRERKKGAIEDSRQLRMSRQKHHMLAGGRHHTDPTTNPGRLSNLGSRKQGGRHNEGLSTHNTFSRSQMPPGY